MKTKTIILLTLLTTATTLAATPQYDIIPLGKATDNTEAVTLATSINDTGQIIGTHFDFGNYIDFPVLFDASDMSNFESLSNQLSCANSINNNGQIAGSAGSSAAAFDLSNPSECYILGTPGNYDGSSAQAINDHGLVAGSVTVNDTLLSVIFDYNNPGSLTVLPNLSEFTNSYGRSINNNGQIVGYVGDEGYGYRYRDDRDEHYYKSNAVLYQNTEMVQLGTLGGDYSAALDINNNGQVVGSAEDSQNREYATIFDPTGNGNNISLGGIDGKESVGLAINDAGCVVGALMQMDTYGGDVLQWSPFYYDGFQMVDLRNCISPDSGWHVSVAWDINNLGQIIGWGYYNGQQRPFLMTPSTIPEPATLAIFAIGALLIRRGKYIN